MSSTYQNSTPPRIPPTINAAVISTDLLQENNMLFLKAGLNKLVGTATLVAGTVTVSNKLVSVGDYVFVSLSNPGGTAGNSYSVPSATVLDGSFVINSVSTTGTLVNTDTSTLKYMIVKPVV